MINVGEICNEVKGILERKNKDYGNSFSEQWREYGMISSCIRLEDKMRRLKRLTMSSERYVKDESIRDTLLDMCGYAILTINELDILNNEEIMFEENGK